MPLSLSPEQKQPAFWLVLWLACGLLLHAVDPNPTPFIAAVIVMLASLAAAGALVPMVAFKHLKRHYLRSSFYNA